MPAACAYSWSKLSMGVEGSIARNVSAVTDIPPASHLSSRNPLKKPERDWKLLPSASEIDLLQGSGLSFRFEGSGFRVLDFGFQVKRV